MIVRESGEVVNFAIYSFTTYHPDLKCLSCCRDITINIKISILFFNFTEGIGNW